ncbi:MAG: RluA family pseudouridine synthase [Clostridiales bacterium]|nr:RluA family pseudouridine synthase [Clostridiales bacterium]
MLNNDHPSENDHNPQGRCATAAPRYLSAAVEPERDGQRVDRIARSQMGVSGTLLRRVKWLDDGILLDGVRVTTRDRARGGQTLTLRLSDPGEGESMTAAAIPLDIRYEDRDIVVVNKAPGMSTHPGPGHWEDSLGNALTWHWQQKDPFAAFHPVHRLDRGTSGLMVVAAHPFAQERLRQSLHTGDFRRQYLAVCEGCLTPSEGVIDLPIDRCPDSIQKRQVSPGGQPSVTRYRVLAQARGRSLVALELETGRTHQIRVHLSHLGCPLVGDYLYGTPCPEVIDRPALHSWRLELAHPVTGARLVFEQPLPADMAALLDGQHCS